MDSKHHFHVEQILLIVNSSTNGKKELSIIIFLTVNNYY